MLAYWNYDEEKSQYQVLYLYDDWAGKVSYPLQYDSENRKLTGRDTFTAPGGVPAEERVEWWFSEDGNTIRTREYNHYATDPEDFWPLNFESTWVKVK